MMDKHKKIAMIMCSIGLMLLLTGITYSYFNYTKTGDNNNLIAGDIYLTLNEGNGEIELSNVFPETKEEARARNDNYITFSVNGLNTSNKTIYYEFILNHGEDKASPKSRYNDEDLRFDLVEIDSSGNEISYLLDNETYDTLINKRIYTDTVDANTTTEVTRYYKLRMWLNENVVISDTETGANYTATEFPNKYATIKLTVLGDFTEKSYNRSLYSIMKKDAVMDNINSEFVNNTTPGIDFTRTSSSTNGKGIYTRAGTENDTYPIMYYRGEIENNNVLFNNQCWKAVRTTDTGGVKLIYNGSISANKAPLEENDYAIVSNTGNFTFDQSDNTWTRTITGSDGSSNSRLEISFKVPAKENYIMQITGTTSTSGQASIIIYKDTPEVNGTGNGGGEALNFSYKYGTLTADNVIKMAYFGNGTSESPTIIKVKMVYPNEIMGYGCYNIERDALITLSGTNAFTFSGSNLNKSLAYNGYMWGEVYEYTKASTSSGTYYGTGFTWDGTKYALTNAKEGYDGTHHYTCNSGAAEGTCSSIRYYYYVKGTSNNYYVTLTGGDSIEKAIEKMQINTNPSNAKTQIDAWYATNMSTVTSKLEDTIWCNDRSISSKAGWDPNGNVTADFLYYSSYNRASTATPSLSCVSKNDAFTVSNVNGNGKLTYPVALLTSDEVTLAGGKGGSSSSSSTFYLASGAPYWSMSPSYSSDIYVPEFTITNNGILSSRFVDDSIGLRPSISLKPGTQVASGTGTVLDPYVIE